MNVMRGSKFRSGSRGLATIELLIATPVLVMLIVAISELGWALHQYKALTRATRDGVRYVAGHALRSGVGLAIVDANLSQETRNLVVYGNPAGTGTPLLPDWSTAQVTVATVDSQHVQVAASYQYSPIFTVLPLFSGTSSPLDLEMRSSAVMRAL